MRQLSQAVVNFIKREDGPTAVEYAVMLSLIIVVCLVAITALGKTPSATSSPAAQQVGTSPYPPVARRRPAPRRGAGREPGGQWPRRLASFLRPSFPPWRLRNLFAGPATPKKHKLDSFSVG